jgi:uncharacterized protein
MNKTIAIFVVLAGLIGMNRSMVFAQTTVVPLRDPQHVTQKYPMNYKQLKELHIVMQQRDYSCGAAALATVLRYYWGDDIKEDLVLWHIEQILTPEEMQDRIKKGLAISDLRRAAVKMGYLSSIGKMSFEQLANSHVPLVVGISNNGYDHFVVYRGTDCQWVYLADPIRGNIRLTVPEFVCQWQKNTILVVAKKDQEPPETSPLSLTRRDLTRSQLNYQLIHSMPSKPFTLQK